MSASLRIVLAVWLAIASSARADTLGVVVEGPTGLGGPLRVRIEGWAIDHDHKIVPAPLSVDAARTLANCLVIDDRKCAAAVVDKRGKARNVIYARMEESTMTVFWFKKHRPPAGQKLACAPCSDELLAAALDKLASGNAPTPDEGAEPADEQPEEGGGETPEAPAAESPRAPLWSYVAMGGGVALAATGITLYVTSESPTGARPTYLNDRPIGTALVIGGVVAAAVGAYFWLDRDSAPVVAPTKGGAVVGWALLF